MSDEIIGRNVCPECGGASLGSVVCCGGRDSSSFADVYGRYDSEANGMMPPPMLRLIVQPLFVGGSVASDGVNKPIIYVNSNKSKDEVVEALWHEVVHMLKSVGGDDQSEEGVITAAGKLAECCPEIFDWMIKCYE